MAILTRAPRLTPLSNFATLRIAPVQTRRQYADQSPQEASGVVKQKDKDAKPKILEPIPPAEDSQDVKKHNEEFKDRPDRAVNKIDDKGRPVVGKMPTESQSRFAESQATTIAKLCFRESEIGVLVPGQYLACQVKTII